MGIIYEPAGKAREYSPLAANFFNGCGHKCLYCYVPELKRIQFDAFNSGNSPRRDIVSQFAAECEKNAYCQKTVLFNFVGDPYNPFDAETAITRQCLLAAGKNKVPVSVLTKGGSRCLRDLDLFRRFEKHIIVGATLTFITPEKSAEWEAGAASPADRLDALKTLHENGVTTWASFEPVIEPEESLALMRATLDFVDIYKVGKLNNYKGIDKKIDWTAFLKSALSILRPAGKRIYVKNDLAQNAPSVVLSKQERDADSFSAVPWEIPREDLF